MTDGRSRHPRLRKLRDIVAASLAQGLVLRVKANGDVEAVEPSEALGIYVGPNPPALVTHAQWLATRTGYWGKVDTSGQAGAVAGWLPPEQPRSLAACPTSWSSMRGSASVAAPAGAAPLAGAVPALGQGVAPAAGAAPLVGGVPDVAVVAAGPTALKAAQFTLGAGTGTQDVTWAADAAWPDTTQPKLVISLGGRITANGTAVQGISQSLGFMSPTLDRAAWWGNADNVANTQAHGRLRSAGLSLYTPGSPPTADGELSLSSMLANGFRISRDVAFGGSYLVNALALGGASLEVAMGDAATPTVIGQQTYTTGFQPTAIIVMAVLDDDAAADAVDATALVRRCVGFASGLTAGVQCAVPTLQRNAVASNASSLSARWGHTGRIVSVIDWDGATGSEIVKGVLSAWSGTGFTIDWQTVNATSRRFVWIALGGISARAGFFTTAASAGDVVVSASASLRRPGSSPPPASATPTRIRSAARECRSPWQVPT